VTTILFFKPYGVLSQFTREAGHQSLADFGPFPGDVYPAGRLDADTEGLLLLTNDNRLKHRLADPRFFHPKKYLVQVERVPDAEALRRLREGVMIDGERTRPAEAVLLAQEPDLPRGRSRSASAGTSPPPGLRLRSPRAGTGRCGR